MPEPKPVQMGSKPRSKPVEAPKPVSPSQSRVAGLEALEARTEALEQRVERLQDHVNEAVEHLNKITNRLA